MGERQARGHRWRQHLRALRRTHEGPADCGYGSAEAGAYCARRNVRAAWRTALIGLDRRNQAGGAVLVDDFADDLEDTRALEWKLTLLEELVADPSRTVVLLSQLSPTGLNDSLRYRVRGGHAIQGKRYKKSDEPRLETLNDPADERWRRVLKGFVFVDWREIETQLSGGQAMVAIQGQALPDGSQSLQAATVQHKVSVWSWAVSTIEALRMGRVKVGALLDAEGGSHPFVKRVCEELRQSEAVLKGRVTLEQAFDEIAERAALCYRSIWASCSEDEKVVLSHIAQHGLANASARTVVRRLLGRRLLYKDPALRPMNETFRRFVLSKECWRQVAVIETAGGQSAWDCLRIPLGVGVVGGGLFLFATQKELSTRFSRSRPLPRFRCRRSSARSACLRAVA